jgi:hypothetical protein
MGDWKLLLNASQKDAEEAKAGESAGGKVELYNVASDIGETKDMAASNPEKVKELRAKLAEYQKGFVPMGGGDAPAAGPKGAGAKRAGKK